MLAIEIEFLTGRYVATASHTRQAGEWPPHPARLFSALVATYAAGEGSDAGERAALLWLEGLEAPRIHASEATARDVVTVFVPVNDAGITNVDDEATACDEARDEVEAARARADAKALKAAERHLKKAEARLHKAIDTQTKQLKGNPATAASVLPEQRTRQPRTFPSVTPVVPRVTYVWPSAAPEDSLRHALTRLLARLVRIGHSSSLVAGRLVGEGADGGDARAIWRPSPSGEDVLRAVQPGQLEALERAFEAHGEVEPRVMPARFVGYTRRSSPAENTTPRSRFSDDWIVLRRVGGDVPPMVVTVAVARALRAALIHHGTDPAPVMLTGKQASGAPAEEDHLALVPLPFVGHHRAAASLHSSSGGLLGVALVLPRGASQADRQAIYRRVAAWEDASRADEEDTPALTLTLGSIGELALARVAWDPVASSLQPHTWCRASKAWVTATPVALDRNPGDLRSREPQRLAAAVKAAESTLRGACARIGLPEPAMVEILPAAPLTGAAKARRYPSFPPIDGSTTRVLTHARLVFDEPVMGPVLLGAGRYTGLGLFRPESNDG